MNTNKINRFLQDKFNFYILRAFPRHSTRFAKIYFKNKPIKVVEIGTFQGYNAKSILKELNVKKIYLVDPYSNYKDYRKSEPSTVKEILFAESEAKYRLRKYNDKITWIRETSDDAVDLIPNDLDFVYIDGNHEYKYVKKDIENYYKKLKKGGLLAGHDIATGFGVSRAVIEFCSKMNINPSINVTDWYFIKE